MSEVVNGRKLRDIVILSGRYIKKDPESYLAFRKKINVEPLVITDVKCKGKFIYFLTNSDWSIWNTLGMSGGWSPNDEHPHARVKFLLEDSIVCFNDTRNFGTLKFVNDEKKLQKKLKSLGTDILAEEIPFDIFKNKIMYYNGKTLPEILMDQSLFSGIGNYLKAESLYLAKLSPHRYAYTLTDEEIESLRKATHSIIRESYRSGGSTLRTYADFNGAPGNFSDRFMVYKQKVDPQGNPVIKEETKDKRVTHWVPNIQK